ncbi:hypothetical protein TRVL_03925 [Trypanosoma vivax]|nr:hypothetical protein TRVL_03925 [Trypanosoma vivax]
MKHLGVWVIATIVLFARFVTAQNSTRGAKAVGLATTVCDVLANLKADAFQALGRNGKLVKEVDLHAYGENKLDALSVAAWRYPTTARSSAQQRGRGEGCGGTCRLFGRAGARGSNGR